MAVESGENAEPPRQQMDYMASGITTFVYVTYIRTTPEKLWSAPTEPEFREQYWFGVHCESEWTAGSSTHTIEREPSKLIGAVSGGWPKILSNLKSLLETGSTIL